MTASNLQDLENKMVNATVQAINKRIAANTPKMIDGVKEVLRNAFEGSQLWIDLQTDILRGEIGLVAPAQALQQILDAMCDSIQIESNFHAKNKSIGGSLKLTAIPSNHLDLIRLPLASFISEKGHTINYLDWLLHSGLTQVVTDYHFIEKPGSGRVGFGLMVPKGNWTIPGEYAGTQNDNFITRTLEQCHEQIIKVLIRGMTNKTL